MERYVAVDNICAWPNLTRLRDGAIVAAVFNQPCHGLWEGDVECWASNDGGRTWRWRGTPAFHEPGTNRMNVAAGLNAAGDLVVLASGWSHRPRRGAGIATHTHEPPAHPLAPWVCRSSDGGHTWAREGSVEVPKGESDEVIPFGDIVELRDGSLGACLYSRRSTQLHACSLYASEDDGRTWRLRGVIRNENLNETAPLVLPFGDVLSCGRTREDQRLELFRSTDHGTSWRREALVSGASQHPGHLMLLSDGRVLLTYGDRRDGHHGVEVRLGDSDGRYWGAPRRVVSLEPGDLGYPATVRGDDGSLVTAWYSAGVHAHQRYHMGVAIWTIDELFA